MASSREKYFKNYKFEQIPDSSKKGYKNVYTYVGDYYTWDIPESSVKGLRILFSAFELITILSFSLAAFQNIASNKAAYIAIPAVFSICIWIFEIIAVGFFLILKLPLKEEDYKRIDSTFSVAFPLRFFLLLFAAVACIVDAIRLSLGFFGITTAFGYLLCALSALFMYWFYRKLREKKKVILSE